MNAAISTRKAVGGRPVFPTGLAIGAGSLVTLLVFSAGLGYWNTLQLRENDAWVTHTNEVLDALGRCPLDNEGRRDGPAWLPDYRRGPLPRTVQRRRGCHPRKRSASEAFDGGQPPATSPHPAPGRTDFGQTEDRGPDHCLEEERPRGGSAGRLDRRRQEGHGRDSSAGPGRCNKRNRACSSPASDNPVKVTWWPLSPSSLPLSWAWGWSGRLSTSSQRHLAERQKTGRSLARLAAIVESSDDAILSKDLHGIIQTWNAGAERLFGYRAEEVIGQPITLLLPPERIQEEEQILDRLLGGQRVEHLETVRVTKDGGRIDVSVTVSPIRGEDGRIIGASKIVHDIADRKRAEEELRRVAQFPDENPYPILRIDRAGTVLYANRSSAALSGAWRCEVGRPAPESFAHWSRKRWPGGRTGRWTWKPQAGSARTSSRRSRTPAT